MYNTTKNYTDIKKHGAQLRVFYKPDFNTQYTSIELPFGGLSKYLIEENSTQIIKPGTAHLLEHIVLNDHRYDFFVKFMKLGARCNGFTHMSSTVFSLEMIDLNLKTLDTYMKHILSPFVENSVFERQKKIVISEISSRSSFSPLLKKGLLKILGQDFNHFSVIGEQLDIERIQIKELEKIKKYIYNPRELELITFGPKDPKEIAAWFEEFMDSSIDYNFKLKRTLEEKNTKGGIIVSNHVNQVVILLREEIINTQEMVKKYLMMNFFAELIKEQLPNSECSIRTHIDYFNGLGITVIIINSNKEFLLKISKAFIGQKNTIKKLNWSNLKIIKQKILAQFIGSFDYPERISSKLHWLYRNNCLPEDYLWLIHNISIEEIYEYINSFLTTIEGQTIE